jgi:hypothetical protein
MHEGARVKHAQAAESPVFTPGALLRFDFELLVVGVSRQ